MHTPHLEWNDLTVIMAVCRSGSLSGAARLLKQNHSTVFRKVNAIEERSGVRFFERHASGYTMTEAGEIALTYAERIEAEVHALGREILGKDMRLQGTVRITAPEGMAALMLPKPLTRFSDEHPDVSLHISGTHAALDLSRREAEVAIRATRKPPEASMGRKICDFRFAIYGSEEYLRAHKDAPLAKRKWCLLDGIDKWLVPFVWKKADDREKYTAITGGAVITVLNAVAAGAGMTFLPCYLGDADKRLHRFGKPLEEHTIELWLLTHPDLRHTARVKVLMEFLFEFLKTERDLFEGHRPSH